jgi:hypothetical protein
LPKAAQNTLSVAVAEDAFTVNPRLFAVAIQTLGGVEPMPPPIRVSRTQTDPAAKGVANVMENVPATMAVAPVMMRMAEGVAALNE